MKFIAILFFIVFCSITVSFSDTGCLINGSTVYPNKEPNNNPNTGNVLYNSSYPFQRRTSDNDPNCGVRDNKLPFTSNYTACDVIGIGNYGGLVTWNPSDNNCPTVNNAPLDDYIPLFILIFCGIGLVAINKRRLI